MTRALAAAEHRDVLLHLDALGRARRRDLEVPLVGAHGRFVLVAFAMRVAEQDLGFGRPRRLVAVELDRALELRDGVTTTAGIVERAPELERRVARVGRDAHGI